MNPDNSNISDAGRGILKTLMCSLPEYIGRIEKKYEEGEMRAARIMSLALPLFELKGVILNGFGCVLRLPGAIATIPLFTILLFIEKNSFGFTALSKIAMDLPTPFSVIILAFKTYLCACNIILAPIIGLFSPRFIVNIHNLCGLSNSSKILLTNDIKKPGVKESTNEIPRGFEAIVGMHDVKQQMKIIIDNLVEPKLAKRYEITQSNGIIFYGPPGNGKTHFVEKFAEELEKVSNKKVGFHSISSANMSKWMGETSQNIRKVFEAAALDALTNKSLSIVFIDEIDTIISSSKIGGSSVTAQAFAIERGTFLTLLNEAASKNVLVIGATNHLEQLDEAITRSGRFDAKILVKHPDLTFRTSLLSTFLHTDIITPGIRFDQFAEQMEGWSVADIKLFSARVRIKAFNIAQQNKKNGSAEFVLINQDMLEAVFKEQDESADVNSQAPKISAGPQGFDAIIGMNALKKQMLSVMNTILNPTLTKLYDLKLTSGIIFYGPPGNGKTHFVGKFKEELEKISQKKVAYHTISSNNTSKWIGETSHNITRIFEAAASDAKRNNSLSIIFIDEIDTIIPSSKSQGVSSVSESLDQNRGTFLRLLNEASSKNVLVIGATNHLSKLDEAIIRSGRFDAKILVPNPDLELRKTLLAEFLNKKIPQDELSFDDLADKMDGWSIADIQLYAQKVREKAFNKTQKNLANQSDKHEPITQAMLNKVFNSHLEVLKNTHATKAKFQLYN